jgi:hypothetical protein
VWAFFLTSIIGSARKCTLSNCLNPTPRHPPGIFSFVRVGCGRCVCGLSLLPKCCLAGACEAVCRGVGIFPHDWHLDLHFAPAPRLRTGAPPQPTILHSALDLRLAAPPPAPPCALKCNNQNMWFSREQLGSSTCLYIILHNIILFTSREQLGSSTCLYIILHNIILFTRVVIIPFII